MYYPKELIPEIPKKVYINTAGNITYEWWCPKCNTYHWGSHECIYEDYEFCPHCGQLIKKGGYYG